MGDDNKTKYNDDNGIDIDNKHGLLLASERT